MKLAIITDQHFGARNDSLIFHDYFRRFYSLIFFPTLDTHGIKTVLLGGDTFDRRKHINFLSLELSRQYFFDECKKRGIRVIANIGNHDVFYKNTNDVNSPELLLQGYENIEVVWQPTEFKFESLEVLVVPWITSDNYNITMHQVQNTTAPIMLGHLELAGYEMYKGAVIDHGMSDTLFEKFDMVLSGHYHHRSTRRNIHYLGAPYQMTWSDYDDDRGFHILDTETRELQFVKNPLVMFERVVYDDTGITEFTQFDVDFSKYSSMFIKLVVRKKSNPYLFDLFIEALEKVGVSDLQVVDDSLIITGEETDDEDLDVENTVTLISKYVQTIDGIDEQVKSKLDMYMRNLYNDAVNVSREKVQ